MLQRHEVRKQLQRDYLQYRQQIFRRFRYKDSVARKLRSQSITCTSFVQNEMLTLKRIKNWSSSGLRSRSQGQGNPRGLRKLASWQLWRTWRQYEGQPSQRDLSGTSLCPTAPLSEIKQSTDIHQA